jgi:hypothetical protein
LRLHTLYLGSRDGGPFTPGDRQAVVRETASVFAGFTLSEAQGYDRRRPVATLRL